MRLNFIHYNSPLKAVLGFGLKNRMQRILLPHLQAQHIVFSKAQFQDLFAQFQLFCLIAEPQALLP
jgi:hypothetical protein